MNYQEAWTFLDNLQFFKIKLGLDSMTEFLDRLGQPQQALKFVHVAGTNGKGSVAVTLLTILAEAGYQVGLYTSPHLNSVRERFCINGAFITEAEFAAEAARIIEILEGRPITYFEFTTALALLWFARRQVDVVILEVGLGGRLDATNVITPLVGVITNVSMDHEAYLGDTLTRVAREKAGIIKAGVPVVAGVGPDQADPAGEVLAVVDQVSRDQGAPLFLYGRDFEAEAGAERDWTYRGVKRSGRAGKTMTGLIGSLQGKYQRRNAALALAALELLEEKGLAVSEAQIRAGLKQVRWPGRLEYFRLAQPAGDRQYLLDGAHNPAGVQSLIEALTTDYHYRHLILVWGAMADKDIAGTLPKIARLADHLLLTRPRGERSAAPAMLRQMLPPERRDRAVCLPVVAGALQKAAELAGPADLICVAGSLYLIGESRGLLLGELA